MKHPNRFAILLVAGLVLAPAAATPQAVTDQWSAIVLPTAPPVSSATVDPKTTALLVMDFNKIGCTQEHRPRCVVALPRVQALLAAARAHGLFIVHTLAAPTTVADISPELTPRAGEPVFTAAPDKFIDTEPNLLGLLKSHGIVTVITTGTSANGAVLHTAAGAAIRGFKVIVPVDAMPGDTPFTEGYAVWHLVHAPRVADKVTLTKTSEITFAP